MNFTLPKFACFSIFSLLIFCCSCDVNTISEQSKATKTFSNIQYGEEAYQQFDFWEMDNDADDASLLIVLHQGSFLNGFGDKNSTEVLELSQRLGAVKNIKVVSLNYNTINFKNELNNFFPETKEDLLDTEFWSSFKDKLSWENFIRKNIYKAHTDINNVINFFKINTDSFKVNTDKIFLVGYSAGAILSLSYAYSDTSELHDLFGDYYPNFNHFKNRENIKGIVSLSGALFDYRIADKNDLSIPNILFHGVEDKIVSINSDYPLKTYVNADTRIPILPKNNLFSFGGVDLVWAPEISVSAWLKLKILKTLVPKIDGSGIVHKRFEELGFDSELIKLKAKHNLLFNEAGEKTEDFEKIIRKSQSFLKKHNNQSWFN